MTRTTKTPAQRAQEAVDILQRRLVNLRGKSSDLAGQVLANSNEIDIVEKRLAYARANPDLPNQEKTP